MQRFLAEVLPLSGNEFAPSDAKCSPVALTIRQLPTSGPESVLDPTTSLLFQITEAVILECEAELDVNEDAVLSGVIGHEEKREQAARLFARRRVDEAIAHLAFAMCLALPDGVHFTEPHFMPENEPVVSAVGWGDLTRPAKAKEMDWPAVHDLPLLDVMKWLDRIPGYRDGVGRGPVGRAVAALSQSMAARGSPKLVWAMVGLEALYCRTADGLKRQLSAHSQLLLGPIPRSKKHFGQLYDYRSAFLHGSLDLPLSHRERDGDTDAWEFATRSHGEADLAEAVLLASIQELIRRDWQTIDFSSSLVGGPIED